MITALREATKSLWMWIILGVLALGFGLSFGLPSDAISLGQDPIVKVYGEPVRPHDYNYQWAAFNVTNYIRIPKQDKRMQEMMGLKEEVLDAVIERRVLAKAGEEMGLHVDIADAEDLTFEGHIIILGDTIDWLGGRKFNYERLFKGGLLQTLQSNERDYLERQRREIMARTVRDLVASTAVIPEAELRKEYESRANRVSLRYVRFQSAFYADLVDPTPEEIDAYVKEHRDELSKQFESQGVRFTKLPKQVRLRFIKVEKPSAPEVEEGATVEPAAQKAHDEAVAAARAKIEAAIAQLDEGKDFRQVAREVSQDATTGRRGGDYGWVSLEGTGTGLEAIVDETAAKLEPGQVSAVVESDAAFYLIKIDGAREGDVAEDEALRELAEEALMTAGGKTLAKQAAEEALLKVREERKPLAELFDDKDALGADSPGIDSLPIDELGESATGLDAMRPKISVTG
ncbi:MAG: peptidylprolyl isomerase, partial [Myxococcales bacterium]|nr:peptidylprolyl isomerase [Myxococcales bacterium]